MRCCCCCRLLCPCCCKKKAPVIPEVDAKMEEVMTKTNMTDKELALLFEKFRSYDSKVTLTSGTIDVDEFYEMIHEPKSMFSESLFELIDVDDSGELDFSEFLQMVGTYCVFGIEEILKFCFFIFDKDKNGLIEMDELMALVDILHGSELTSNLKKALKDADRSGDGKIDFGEFQTLNKIFPPLLYPAFRIQNNMQEYTLGEKFWKDRRAELEAERAKKRKESEQVREAERQRIIRRRKTRVYRRMGCWYYFCCSKRNRLYRKFENEAKEEAEREARRREKRRRARILAMEQREAERRKQERQKEKEKEPPKPPTRHERRDRAADRREKRKRR